MLRQSGVLLAVGDTLVVGMGGRLVGVNPNSGAVLWDAPLANPRGTNEVERLADLVGPVVRAGDVICARAFQSAVGCVNASSSTLRWSRNVGGVNAVGGDADLLVGADASDRVTAWKTPSGEIAWTNEKYLYRSLSGPLAIGPAVLFGDIEGEIHVLARDSGQALLRMPTDGTPVVAQPVITGGTILVATKGGGLFAFRLE